MESFLLYRVGHFEADMKKDQPRCLQSKMRCLHEVYARNEWTYADGGHGHEEGVASTSAEQDALLYGRTGWT